MGSNPKQNERSSCTVWFHRYNLEFDARSSGTMVQYSNDHEAIPSLVTPNRGSHPATERAIRTPMVQAAADERFDPRLARVHDLRRDVELGACVVNPKVSVR